MKSKYSFKLAGHLSWKYVIISGNIKFSQLTFVFHYYAIVGVWLCELPAHAQRVAGSGPRPGRVLSQPDP